MNPNQVDIVNSCYNGELLTKYHALLVGGHEFEKIKASFLLRKPTEGIRTGSSNPIQPGSNSPGQTQPSQYCAYQPVAGSLDQYNYRLRKTSYKPMIASLFGYLAARVFPQNPTIEGNQKLVDLLDNADGKDKPLVSLLREALINALTYSVGGCPTGSYIQLCNVDDEVKLCLFDQRTIIDWEDDDECNLDWVRTRTISPARDDLGKQTKLQWTWMKYSPDKVETWTGITASMTNRPAKVDGPTSEPNELGKCPFIRIELKGYQYLMDQLAPSITEQFNLEADIGSLCSKISNAQFVIQSQTKDMGTMFFPQLGVILLDPGDTASFQSPNPLCAKPLFDYRISLRESIYNSINSSVMRSSADLVQNPRQSASAKELDLEPWKHWSDTFAQPVRTAFTQAINEIAEFYDVPEPTIEWGDTEQVDMNGIKNAMEPDLAGAQSGEETTIPNTDTTE